MPFSVGTANLSHLMELLELSSLRHSWPVLLFLDNLNLSVFQSCKACFQEVEIPSLSNWKPSDFKYIPTVLKIHVLTEEKVTYVVRIVIEGNKAVQHNL